MEITPQAIRAPAFPVVRLTLVPPNPKSSLSWWIDNRSTHDGVAAVQLDNRIVDGEIYRPISTGVDIAQVAHVTDGSCRCTMILILRIKMAARVVAHITQISFVMHVEAVLALCQSGQLASHLEKTVQSRKK